MQIYVAWEINKRRYRCACTCTTIISLASWRCGWMYLSSDWNVGMEGYSSSGRTGRGDEMELSPLMSITSQSAWSQPRIKGRAWTGDIIVESATGLHNQEALYFETVKPDEASCKSVCQVCLLTLLLRIYSCLSDIFMLRRT